MLTKRIVPVVLVRQYQIIKSRGFSDYRVVGNFEQTVSVYNKRKVDELLILDIDASKNKSVPSSNMLNILSKDLDVPITYGGGINGINDISDCLSSGCDRVSINTALIGNPKIVKEAVSVFGSQCIVGSIDYQIRDDNAYVFDHVNNCILNKTLPDFIDSVIALGVGEIILTNVDREGMLCGYDQQLQKYIDRYDISLLINGGCSKPSDIIEIIDEYQGCCASSMYLYTKYGYRDVKKELELSNINIR